MNIFEDFCRIALCVIVAMALLVGGGLQVYKKLVPPRPPGKYAMAMSKLNYRLLPQWKTQAGHTETVSITGNRIKQRADGTVY